MCPLLHSVLGLFREMKGVRRFFSFDLFYRLQELGPICDWISGENAQAFRKLLFVDLWCFEVLTSGVSSNILQGKSQVESIFSEIFDFLYPHSLALPVNACVSSCILPPLFEIKI